MGKLRKSHSGSGLTEKQDRFGRLIDRGVSNTEACRIVGVNRHTGTRWRFGRTVRTAAGDLVHYSPVRTPNPPKLRHPRDLSIQERTMIANLYREHKTLRQIAAVIRRDPATISRELRRNTDPAGRYLPGAADRFASERVIRPRKRRVVVDDQLCAV